MPAASVARAIRLPQSPPKYDPADQAAMRHELETHLMSMTPNDTKLPIPYITDSQFRADPDGDVDSTDQIQAAHDFALAEGFGAIGVPKGDFKIGSDLNIDRTIDLQGMGAQKSRIFASSQKRVNFVNQGGWTHETANIKFDKVGLLYGPTVNDSGIGAVTRGCELLNSDKAIIYRNNCFLTRLLHSQVHDNTLGIHYDFVTAGSNAGSTMVVSDSGLFSNGTAAFVDGATADGMHLIYNAVDIEHNTVAGVKSTGASDGMWDFNGCHWELNNGTWLDLDGGTTRIRGGWAFPNGTYDVFAKLRGGARLGISDIRFQWETGATYGKLVDLQDGTLSVDPSSCFGASGFFGANALPMATASSVSGKIVNGGDPTVGYGGRVFNGRSGIFSEGGASATITSSGASKAITTLQAYDYASRVLEFDFAVASVAGAGSNAIRISMDGTNLDMTLPLAAGGGRCRIVYNPGGAFAASVLYNGTYVSATVAAPTHTTRRFLGMTSIGAATTPTIVARNLTEDVR